MSEQIFRAAIENLGLVIDHIRQKADVTAFTGSNRHFTWILAHDTAIGKSYDFFFNCAQSQVSSLKQSDIERWARGQMTEQWQSRWRSEVLLNGG